MQLFTIYFCNINKLFTIYLRKVNKTIYFFKSRVNVPPLAVRQYQI